MEPNRDSGIFYTTQVVEDRAAPDHQLNQTSAILNVVLLIVYGESGENGMPAQYRVVQVCIEASRNVVIKRLHYKKNSYNLKYIHFQYL